MPVRSSSCSPERGETRYSSKDTVHEKHRANNAESFSSSPSFFIIHESSCSVISPSGGVGSPPNLRRKGDDNGVQLLSMSGQRKKKLRLKTPSSAPVSSNTPSTTSQIIDEDRKETEAEDDQVTSNKKQVVELSVLNRCGSAPDLPMSSPLSASVYSSSKKRILQGSPNVTMLQRTRLTPLPVNSRAVAVATSDPLLKSVEKNETRQATRDELAAVSLSAKDPLLQEKLCKDAHAISVLKQRLLVLEREVSAGTKYRHLAEKQTAQLSRENRRLQVDTTQQQLRIDELDKTVLRQHHEYDKLAARYAAVYANLQKLLDQQNPLENSSAQQSALQALARENQDFLRKLRVLEARHAEDKTLTSTQDKKIKRLKAEMEALQHMSEAKSREDDFDEAASDIDQVSRFTRQKKRPEGDNNHKGRPASASSPASVASSTPRRAGSSARVQVVQTSALGAASHLVTAEVYQYIDPNILKVLEKVDSQFSITNAINLSVVLKKWLNSCIHVVCSTHLPTVLQTLLKRVCELLHCEHAALFTVDHATRKLVAVCSERGIERWELPLDKGIAGYAARHNTLCNVHCASDDPRFYSSTDSVTGSTSREVLALPIVHELQLYLASHAVHSGDSNRLGVFAVLRAWNTNHQKPFSPNDQILGSLLAIQAGILLRQAAVTKTLQKINHKTHEILQLPSDIVAKAVTSSPSSEHPSIPSLVQLVAVAQQQLGDCLRIKQVRLFVLDAAALKLWHVGQREADDGNAPALVRRYVTAQASLCSLLLRTDAAAIVVSEPSAEAAFNETVDIPGGARGLYLVPILSPWGHTAQPLGMLQVSRVAKARLSASPFTLTVSEAAANGSVSDIVVNNERDAAQQTEDRLMLELLGLFSRVFAGLLHHVSAQQLFDSCPSEIMQAQLATLTDRLDSLAATRKKEEEEDDTAQARDAATPELDPVRQSGRHASAATAHASTSPQRDTRRVVSAEPKHRAAPESRRATTSPSKRISGSQAADLSQVLSHEPAASGDGATDVDALAPSDAVVIVAETAILEDRADAQAPEPCDSELSAPGPELEAAQSDIVWPATYDATETYNAGDWAPSSDDNLYVAAQDEEQPVGEEGASYTWGDNSAYDPSLWTDGGYAGGYEDGVAWDYGGVGDGASVQEEEAKSTYAIDLHVSSRTSSAAAGQPSGAF
ncbi:GAF domain-containing protein [Phytophthora infestans]|uniref:GAF domain-containing protein n=1 Tax=Phytophthora infestans TaxID=4787 RepID=A0A8S9V187_PHYIN|nr:GAF domain-containing protein [Phytophthora infestans]